MLKTFLFDFVKINFFAVCRGVPLRSEWHDATQIVRKDSLQDTQDETDSSLSNEPVTCINLNKTGRWVQVI